MYYRKYHVSTLRKSYQNFQRTFINLKIVNLEIFLIEYKIRTWTDDIIRNKTNTFFRANQFLINYHKKQNLK